MWILGKQTQIERLDLLKSLNNKSNFNLIKLKKKKTFKTHFQLQIVN
jgi:hypothetical protein